MRCVSSPVVEGRESAESPEFRAFRGMGGVMNWSPDAWIEVMNLALLSEARYAYQARSGHFERC